MGFPATGDWYEAAVRNGLIRDQRAEPAPAAPEAPAKAAGPSDAELVLWAVRQAGFGDPEPEFRFHPTRKWRFDWAWPAVKVALEREGGRWREVNTAAGPVRLLVSRHTSEKGYDADCEKYNAAQIAGWVVIRATPRMVRDGRALAALLEALGRRAPEPPRT